MWDGVGTRGVGVSAGVQLWRFEMKIRCSRVLTTKMLLDRAPKTSSVPHFLNISNLQHIETSAKACKVRRDMLQNVSCNELEDAV